MRFIHSIILAVLLLACSAAVAQTTRPYNVVLILADDLSASELACYGNKTNQTPNLDKLASEGTRFQTCWATPLCTPTRVMLMTGQYGFRTGYYNLYGRHLAPHGIAQKVPVLGISFGAFGDLRKAGITNQYPVIRMFYRRNGINRQAGC